MTTSVRSTALEPGPDDYQGRGVSLLVHRFVRSLPVYGLVYLMVLLTLFFSLAQPDTFPTYLNFKLIANGKAVLAILALGVMIPMAAGKIDISIGYAVGLWHILVLTLQIRYGVPIPVAILTVLALSVLVGLVNGLLVELAQVDAFVATLGTGTILYAIALWHTEGKQVVDTAGAIPDSFWSLAKWEVLAIPGPFLIVIALAVILWIAFEYLPIGRYLYAVGANPRAAELNGIPRRKYVLGAFIASGLFAGLAGVLLAARIQVGQANVSGDYLLPALVAAFLGSTTIKPGRVNPWGTIVGVVILAVGISGIQQLGSAFYVEPLFNGLTLIIAISIASWAGRRRVNALERHTAAAVVTEPAEGPDEEPGPETGAPGTRSTDDARNEEGP
jgi:ribose transport system permease protein